MQSQRVAGASAESTNCMVAGRSRLLPAVPVALAANINGGEAGDDDIDVGDDAGEVVGAAALRPANPNTGEPSSSGNAAHRGRDAGRGIALQ